MSAFKKAATGDRGKWAEKQVETYLKHINEKVAEFAYERLPDARAARGHLKAQVCDYLIWSPGKHFPLEVKETEHEFRLAKDKVAQMPRLRKIKLAGYPGLVLVYHTTLDSWRVAPLSFFDGDIPPSWDLRPLPLFIDHESALESTGMLPTL